MTRINQIPAGRFDPDAAGWRGAMLNTPFPSPAPYPFPRQ
jgi:hypothetical protein